MQLRRSLAVTAVTALASSAALFAAPVAFADESASASPSTGTTATASPTGTASPSASTSKPASGSAKPSTATTAPSSPAAPTTQAAQPQPSAAALPGAGDVVPNPDKGDGPAVSFRNFPAKLVPGAAAKEFSAVVANTTGKSIDVSPEIYLANEKGTLRAGHVRIEYFRDGKWKTAKLMDLGGGQVYGVIGGDWYAEGDDFYYDNPYALGKGQTLDIKLRVSVTKDAPVGLGVGVLGGAAWVNDEENASLASASDFYFFAIVSAEDAPKPADNGTKPKPKPKPSKPGKDLANTGGDDSMATTYAVIGGVALVGGAGLLVVLRRRRPGGEAAA